MDKLESIDSVDGFDLLVSTKETDEPTYWILASISGSN